MGLETMSRVSKKINSCSHIAGNCSYFVGNVPIVGADVPILGICTKCESIHFFYNFVALQHLLDYVTMDDLLYKSS